MTRRAQIFRGSLAGLGLALAALLPGAFSRADDLRAPISGDVTRLDDEEIERRIRLAEGLLDGSRRQAEWWQRGWLGVFAGTAVLQGTRAGVENDGEKRAGLTIDAVKAAGGATRLLLDPLHARLGADPLRSMPEERRADRVRKLIRAEQMLAENAEEARERRSWTRHLVSTGVNLLGGAVLLAIDDPERAAASAGAGLLLSELHLWTQPGRPEDDLGAYHHRVSESLAAPATGSDGDWRLVRKKGGIELRIEF